MLDIVRENNVTWDGFVSSMKEYICDAYNNKSLKKYNDTWKSLFVNNSKLLKVNVIAGNSDNWADVELHLKNVKKNTTLSSSIASILSSYTTKASTSSSTTKNIIVKYQQ